jgi:hypothetical protein
MAKLTCSECGDAATNDLCERCQVVYEMGAELQKEAEQEYYADLHAIETAAENAWLIQAENAGYDEAEVDRKREMEMGILGMFDACRDEAYPDPAPALSHDDLVGDLPF